MSFLSPQRTVVGSPGRFEGIPFRDAPLGSLGEEDMKFIELDFRTTPWRLRARVLWAAIVGGKVVLGGAPTA